MNGAGEHGADGGSGGDAPSVEELQSQLADLSSQNAAMKAKTEELLGETKAAKTKAREIEAAAEAERNRLATEKGDFEQLFKSLEGKYSALQNDHDGLQSKIATEKRDNAALKIATELADGTNAELLSEFISRRLKYTDEGIKVTDQAGSLTVSSLDDLKKEFAGDARFSALLKGNQSSGGGAAGGANGGGAAKEITRSEFNGLNPVEASKFMKEGGKVIND